MTIYWIMLIFPTLGLLAPIKLNRNLSTLTWLWVSLCLILIVGLRHEVGGDWPQYINNFERFSKNFNLFDINIRSDYGYEFISWLVFKFNLTFHYVELILSFFFVYSLYRISEREKYRSLTLVVCFPVFILIMGMGFVRQGTALAFFIIALIIICYNIF